MYYLVEIRVTDSRVSLVASVSIDWLKSLAALFRYGTREGEAEIDRLLE